MLTPPVQLDQTIQLSIKSLGHHGEGVGHYDGFAIFIDGALPGELVEAKVTSCQKRYAKGKLLNVLSASPDRTPPPCPLFERCGGCQIMHLSYQKQLETKRQRVIDAFERIGQFKGIAVEPCIASPSPLAYRNKIQMPVRNTPNGEVIFGLYAKGSHNLVEVDYCEIHCPLGEKIFQAAASIIKKSSLRAYDPASRQGELRHLLIKSAQQTQEGLVILVTHGPKTADLVAIGEKLIQSCPEVKGVVHNRNERGDNVILGEDYTLLAGSLSIEEQLCGLTFKISPASFFQVNPMQAENMYEQAIAFAGLTGTETVLDAYCGVGTLALIFAKKAKKVIGIDCVGAAIEDAMENGKLNGIDNAEFLCGDVKRKVKDLADIDLVLLNPPRQGCEAEVLQQVHAVNPQVIIYISCDPATLARDLSILMPLGYTVETVQPFDMFPQTAHVETVVKLQNKRTKDAI